MNWAFFLLRFAIGLGILSLFFFSQRFWHRGIWRATANFRSQPLRIAVRILWLAALAMIVLAFIDSVRMGHHHLIPRGTFLSALLGLWFFSALFAFLAVKLVRGLDFLWSRIRKRVSPQQLSPVQPVKPIVRPDTPASVEQLLDPSRRYFFRAATAAAGAAPFLGAMYGYAAERLNYQVRRVEIPMNNLTPVLDGMKIVQISDIHLSGYMSRAQVRRAVDMANDLGADLAVVTGDLITGIGDSIADCVEEVRQFARTARYLGLQRQSRDLRARRRRSGSISTPRPA